MNNNIFLEQLTDDNKALQNSLQQLTNHKRTLENQIKKVKNAKAYKFWQKINKFKKKFSTNNLYILFQRYKYNLDNFDIPNHDFIFLTNENAFWKFISFEKVGEDWHIVIKRKKDKRLFLLDQPTFYVLQIINSKKINLKEELFITYGIQEKNFEQIKNVLKRLKLC